MESNRQVALAVRRALVACVVLTAGVGPPAFAQDEQQPLLKEVVVTGSRIPKRDFIADSPIQTVSAETLTNHSDVTLDTALNSLPQVSAAATSTSNNPSGRGRSQVNLRGLGANRNLVLIDGRRGMPSDGALVVDLNTIPSALIENIEIISGGAGAVYGADAVSGVVNLKLRNDFEGAQLYSSWSRTTSEKDGREYLIAGLLGGNFADERGNAVIALDHARRDPVSKGARPFAAQATASTSFLPEGAWFPSGNLPSAAAVNAVFSRYQVPAGAVNPSGTFSFNLDDTLFAVGGAGGQFNVQNYRYDQDQNVATNFFPDFYSWNFEPSNLLVLPLERTSLAGSFTFDVSSAVQAFAQVFYTNYSGSTQIAPSPVPTAVNVAASQYFAPGVANLGQFLIVPTSNPFIPGDLAQLLASRTGDDAQIAGSGATEPFRMRWRTLALGPRAEEYDSNVANIVFGVRGNLSENWLWDLYFTDGRNNSTRTQRGNASINALQRLLAAADGGQSLCAGGFDIFGRNALSPACQSFVGVVSKNSEKATQQVAQASVSGTLAELAAGPLGIAVGVEYRDNEYHYLPDNILATGDVSGFNAENPLDGRLKTKDVFTEIGIPIVSDKRWAQSISATLGFRYSDNDVTGGSNSYKAEGNWQPVEALRLRGSYQHAVRMPNMAELFYTADSAPQTLDPCSTNLVYRQGPNAAQLRALCIATGISPAAVDTFTQAQSQINQRLIGNINLDNETADTYTLGLVFNAPGESDWASRLRGSIDYYDIEIEDVILFPTDGGVGPRPSPQVILSACYNVYGTNPTYDRNNPYCQGVTRQGNQLQQFTNTAINGGKLATSGVDLQLEWGFDLAWVGLPERAGKLDFSAVTSWTNKWQQQDRPDLPTLDYAGTIAYFGEAFGSAFPEWKGVLTTQYTVGKWSADLRGRYVGSMANRQSIQFPGEVNTGVPSTWYLDVGVEWQPVEWGRVRLGLVNALDQDPRLYTPNQQSGTDPSVYDVLGRRIYGTVQLTF